MSLISPDPAPQSSVSIEFAPYDSEILKIEEVVRKLNEAQGEERNLEAFRQEIIHRFFDAGFRVQVKVYETSQTRTYWWEIVIAGRVDAHEFDPDRQVHEVTSDILGLGEGGVIKTDSAMLRSLQHSSEGHGHHHH